MSNFSSLTLVNLFENSISKHKKRPALSMVETSPMTYEEVGQKTKAVTEKLNTLGINQGDKVAILSENIPNWGIAYFAITTMGAVVVPILTDFHQNEIHHILRHSEAKAVFVSEKLFLKIEDAGIDTLKHVIIINDFSVIPPDTKKDFLSKILAEGQKEFYNFKQSLRTKDKNIVVNENDLASIIYTSGTMGHSKGVMLSHKNLVSDVLFTLKIQPIKPQDRLFSILPLSHSYECTIGFLIPFSQGASIYYFDKPPVAKVLIPALQKIRPTMMLTVPLIIEKIHKTKVLPQFNSHFIFKHLYQIETFRKLLNKLAAQKIYRMFGGKLHFFGIGGALLASDTEQFLREGGFPYAIGYGLTETSPLIAGCGPHLTKFRSTGYVIPGVEVKIYNPETPSGIGEIWVKGDNVMKGYYKNPELTNTVMTSDNWFMTGDLGYLDKDNYLYITGRLKNVIVGPSGENIYPEQIESIINRIDYVLESLVYLSDGQLTARVFLNYEEIEKELHHKRLPESMTSEFVRKKLEEVKIFVNSNISAFSKIKKVIEQSEPFEKTPTRKIKRYLYIN